MSLSTRKNTYPENCRVFVGNLDYSSTDKDELAKIFAPYGELAEEVHIHKGFAFVQYKTPEDAQDAIKGEQARQIGNKKIDLGLAKGGKHKEGRRRSRSPPRDRFKRDRPSNFYPEERVYKKPISDYPQNRPSTNLEPVGVIPLLVIHTALRNYANHIHSNFSSAGINVDVRFVNSTVFQKTIDDSVTYGDRYTMYINRKNEENGTISFRATKPDGVSPGIADVSVNDAINFILKNEKDYAQLLSSQMNRFPQSNYSQYQKPYDYPPQNDYYQPQQQHFQQQPIFSNDQYINQPLINESNQNDYYQPQQPQIQSQSQQTPELQNILLNLLTTLKEPENKSVTTTTNGTTNENVSEFGEDKDVVAQNSNELKQFISKNKSVPIQNIILLLPDGKEVDNSTNFSQTTNTFYVYSHDFREKQKENSQPQTFQDLFSIDSNILEPDQIENQIKVSQQIQEEAQVKFLDATICQYYQTVKKDGLSILVTNLQSLFSEYKNSLENFRAEIVSYNEFMSLFDIQKDTKLLKETPIIKCLSTENKKYLIDMVKDINPTEEFVQCKRFIPALQRQLNTWYEQTDSLEKDIRSSTIESSSIIDVEDPFEPFLENSQNLLDSQKMIFKDQNYIVDEIKKVGNSNSSQLSSLINQLKNMNPFKKYEENDNLLRKELWNCQELNVKFNKSFVDIMKKTLETRAKISTLNDKMRVYQNMSESNLKEQIGSLKLIHFLPESYETTLNEISRRTLFKETLMKDIKSMNEVLRLVSEEENNNRKKYNETVDGLIPNDLKVGLDENAPLFSVQVIGFDENLPNLNEQLNEQNIDSNSSPDDKVEKYGDISKLLSKSYFGTESLIMRNLSESSMLESLSMLVRETEEKTKAIQSSGNVTTSDSKQQNVKIISDEKKSELNEENEKLKKKIEELNDKILKQEKESNQKISELTTENNQLKETMGIQEKEIEEYKAKKEEEIKWAQEQMQKDTYQLTERQKQSQQDFEKSMKILSETKEKERKANEQIQSLTTENKTLSLSLQSIQKNQEVQISKNKKLTNELNLLKTQNSNLSKTLTQTKVSKDVVVKDLEKNTFQLNNLIKKDQTNEKELNSLKYEVQNLRENYSKLMKKDKDLMSSFETIKFENGKLVDQLNTFKKTYNELNSKNQQMKLDFEESLNKEKSLTRTIEELSKASKNATDLKFILENERKQSQIEMSKSKENFENQIKSINLSNQEESSLLKQKISELEIKNEKLSKDLKLKSGSTNSNQDQENKIKQLSSIVNNATSIISAKTQEIAKLNENYVKIEKSFNESKQVLEKLDSKNSQLIQVISTSNENYQTIEGLGNQIQNTKNILDTFMRILSPLNNVTQTRNVLGQLTIKYQSLEGIYKHMFKLSKKIKQQNTISVSNFEYGDKVIFFKKDRSKDTWECFNLDSPNYYLDQDSIQAIKQKQKNDSFASVIGMIIAISPVNNIKEIH
eukprot:gene1775-544_t